MEVTKNSHDGIKNNNLITNQFTNQPTNKYVTVFDGQYLKLKNAEVNLKNVKRVATEENKISTPAQNTPKILDLGLSPFAFSQQFNQNSQSIAPEIGFYVNEPQIQIGEKQNVFQYNFTGNLGMLGIVDKSNGNVKEIMIISTPKTADDILGGVLLYGISIMTVSPQLTVDQRSTILNELQLSNPESTDFLHLDRKITYGNYIYSAKFVQNIGLRYSISPKDLN